MWTIGEHMLQVAADRGVDQSVDAIEQFLRSLKVPGPRRIEVNELAFESVENRHTRCCRGLGRGPLDLNIAEPVVAESGSPGFAAGTAKSVTERLRAAGRSLAHEAGSLQ